MNNTSEIILIIKPRALEVDLKVDIHLSQTCLFWNFRTKLKIYSDLKVELNSLDFDQILNLICILDSLSSLFFKSRT